MERLKIRSQQTNLNLLPAKVLLDFVAFDLLGPLNRTTGGHRNFFVITERFTKLVRAVSLLKIQVLTVARAFLTHWILF